ncbi:MAG: vWA domain-containing protein [Candidatus Bathyarchaeia archaeon]
MRIIEAMIACAILIFGIFATSYFSSVFTTEEGGDLEEAGQSVIHFLSNTDLIKQIIQNETNWDSKVRSLITTLLPPGTFYNMTLVSGLSGQFLADPICNMEELSTLNLDVVTLQQVVTVSLPLTRTVERNLDVIFIIDRAHSMREKEPGDEYSKYYYAHRAIAAFAEKLNATKDRVGIVSFSGNNNAFPNDNDATLDLPLTSNISQVDSTLNKIQTTWNRHDFGYAFKLAYDEFNDNGRSEATRAVIFLSDGVCNDPWFNEDGNEHAKHKFEIPCPVAQEYARNESRKVSELGVLIYTIGLGANTTCFDEPLLKEIQTNGYFYAPSGKDLMGIYDAIVKDLLFEVKYDIVILTLTLVKTG